ncbi:DEAD/DEAH box helicase, partial [Zoogloea sp.]|uniref:DEAD/DEAH box helicase n=1 Tax=Zoogloea sp. TaxID=49181 RepID=UPI001AC01B70
MTQAQSGAQAPVAITFADLALCEPIQRAIADTGYTVPTPIQAQAIPQVLAGGDLMAAAQTGTGKTAGFTLPILHILSEEHAHNIKPGRPRCLILTPTRELAAQVEVRGLDIFRPDTMETDSIEAENLPCWMLDTNYNGMVFCAS